MANRFWTFRDKVYIAKFFEHDGCVRLAALFGARHKTIVTIYNKMKRSGKLNLYRNYWDAIHGWEVSDGKRQRVPVCQT